MFQPFLKRASPQTAICPDSLPVKGKKLDRPTALVTSSTLSGIIGRVVKGMQKVGKDAQMNIVQVTLRGYWLVNGGFAASQVDLPSLTQFYVVVSGRLQLWVAHWATSAALLQVVIIDPINSGSRFSSAGLLAIYIYKQDFTTTYKCSLNLEYISIHWR